ncbi:hypothetical protein [Shewanella acanthi]|uniref:hypothetical protein n=1 Tax=Shewanella acanthi TaxID=2864212 RepID=UPI001C655369|nr:hypothetical protein [Shewanella acanthi]QYJ80386.1 hypothetical protein K0H61_08440 [Shewanella acanthi]
MAVPVYLKLERQEAYFSIVVFCDKATFKTHMPANVIHESELVAYIKSFNLVQNRFFDDLEFERLSSEFEIAQSFSHQEAKALHLALLNHRRFEPSISKLAD